MVENVSTGGLMRFRYAPEGRQQKLDAERRALIEQGYREAEERKQRERKNRLIFWIILFLILIFFGGYFILQ